MDRGGARYYVATDQVGTPRVVNNSAGTVVKTVESDSFGRLLSDSNPAFVLQIAFAGGLADPLTGLVHFGFRDYEPAAGRWTARDPALFEGGAMNLYVYAENEPINSVDTSGLATVGFSAYGGGGGGVSVTLEWGVGFKVCGELGLGAGGGLELDPFSQVGETDTSLVGIAEASAKLGIAKIGSGLEIGHKGGPCPGGIGVKGKLTAGVLGVVDVTATSNDGSDIDKVNVKAKLGLKSLKLGDKDPLGAGISAKVAGRVCGGAKF
jgi:RHS repeat-associated protein